MSQITVDTSDPKDAIKAVRAAIRAEKKQLAINNAAHATAQLRANSVGYRVLERKLSGKGYPCMWRTYRDGDKYYSHFVHKPTDDDSWTRDHHHVISTCDGSVTLQHYGNTIDGIVTDGGGWPIVVFLRDKTTTEVTAYAVGACDGQIAIADLPGISQAEFVRDKESD